MSNKIPGFQNRSIAHIQKSCFQNYLPKHSGKFPYRTTGLNTAPGSLILFQFQARIIASALFLRDEKFPKPRAGCAGAIHLDVKSIQTFDSLDAATMKKIWPAFRAFGHVKQFLNPGGYPAFKKRLKNVTSL